MWRHGRACGSSNSLRHNEHSRKCAADAISCHVPIKMFVSIGSYNVWNSVTEFSLQQFQAVLCFSNVLLPILEPIMLCDIIVSIKRTLSLVTLLICAYNSILRAVSVECILNSFAFSFSPRNLRGSQYVF